MRKEEIKKLALTRQRGKGKLQKRLTAVHKKVVSSRKPEQRLHDEIMDILLAMYRHRTNCGHFSRTAQRSE